MKTLMLYVLSSMDKNIKGRGDNQTTIQDFRINILMILKRVFSIWEK